MTYATASLLECREVVQEHTDLTDNELGIVGDLSHDGGYHQGWDLRRIVNGVLKDYSWQESARDWNHKTNAARAFDVGMFDRLREMSIWIVQQCELGAPDTQDLRSVIYSPDGVQVLRWDRLGLHSGGDSSHLQHTHFSWFADAELNNKARLFRRFFEGVNDMARVIHQEGQGWWLVGNGEPQPMQTEAQVQDNVNVFGPVVTVQDQSHFGIPPKPKPPVPGVDVDALAAALAPKLKPVVDETVRAIFRDGGTA